MSADPTALLDLAAPVPVTQPPPTFNAAPRRFARFAGAGVALTSVPYLWVLWDLWSGGVDPLRAEPFDSNFYDLQVRAIFAGRLSLPTGSIGIEAFVHDGRQYSYFGIFPALLRMPILAFTHSLDGRLTAPSMLLAWLVTALFGSLLVWRVRVLARGEAALGRAEAASLGVLVASLTGGSVLVYLAATPWVFDEDFAWSVALTIASLFALLGLLERPSRGRALVCGGFVLATSLSRAPAGYGCEIAAILVAVWFWTGRGGGEWRRWALAALAIGLVPLTIAGLVNTAKFGSPFALPMADQVWTSMNAHRRQFLAVNGGKAFSPAFLPSTLVAYLEPTGLHFSSVFPFVTLPTTPAGPVAGAFLDQTYPTASVTASMPLLFLLGCWGVVTAVRRKPPGGLRLVRLPLVGAAAACSGALLWGYIADRYLADFVPFMFLAATVGLVDVWRRLDGRRRGARRGAFAGVAALGLFGVVANVAVSTTPAPTAWTSKQVANYISFQDKVSNLTGHPLAGTVVRGAALPYYAPSGELFDVGDCSGLYLSSGYSYATVPDEQYEHLTWFPIEQGPSVAHLLTVVFQPVLAGWSHAFTLLKVGGSTLIARVSAVKPNGELVVIVAEHDPHNPPPGHSPPPGVVQVGVVANLLTVRPGTAYDAELVADPSIDQLSLVVAGRTYLTGPFTPDGHPLVLEGSDLATGTPLVTFTSRPSPRSATALCESLVGGS
jgi:hypothetical protein